MGSPSERSKDDCGALGRTCAAKWTRTEETEMTTNDTTDMHRPTAEFRDYLEGEVTREYRRRRTFRRLRAAAVIIVSAGIGMTATLASAQVRESSAKDSLLAAARAD